MQSRLSGEILKQMAWLVVVLSLKEIIVLQHLKYVFLFYTSNLMQSPKDIVRIILLVTCSLPKKLQLNLKKS